MNYKQLASCLFKALKIEKKAVCFMSFYGLYNDNPRYISEELYRTHPEIKIYWCIDSKRCHTKEIPEYVIKVSMGGLQKLIIQNRCAVIVDNIAGWYSMSVSAKNYKIVHYIKNDKVFNLSTWHGTPKKKIGLDATAGSRDMVFFTTSDLLMSNSEYTNKIYKRCFQDRMKIQLTGTPRNDLLVNLTLEKKKEILHKFNLDDGYSYVIYAPTFRSPESGVAYNPGFDFMYGLDINLLLDSLSIRFGGKWKLIFRGHQFDQSRFDFRKFVDGMNVEIIDGNKFEDMAEYLAISDVLITDYSGSLFDFVVTDKPCFLYTPDRYIYESSSRGVYDVSIPYKYNMSNYELSESIKTFDEQKHIKMNREFSSKLGLFEDGKASERAVRIIMEHI